MDETINDKQLAFIKEQYLIFHREYQIFLNIAWTDDVQLWVALNLNCDVTVLVSPMRQVIMNKNRYVVQDNTPIAGAAGISQFNASMVITETSDYTVALTMINLKLHYI